jgi:hypothetical protein
VPARLRAKARGRKTVAAAERAGEVRGLPVADQTRNVVHRDPRLLGQQLRRRCHPPRE